MILYRIKHNTLGGGAVIWTTIHEALEEIKMHLTEGSNGDEITVSIIEMTESKYKELPEFRGY